VSGHVTHAVEPGPLHSLQEELHAAHLATPSTTSTKVPSLGHVSMQLPEWRKGLAAWVHVMQSELLAAVQVPHDSSHASQRWTPLLESAYLPTGVHEARHVPVAPAVPSKNGCVKAQLVHSEAAGPVHVAQEASQPEQVSAVVGEPPEHVKPSSMVAQFSSQPSRLRRLPSSHASVPTRRPSPQMGTHASMLVEVPPLHVKPGSTVHVSLQPSPAAVLLSSHASLAGAHMMRRPSPQMTVQVSRPPMP